MLTVKEEKEIDDPINPYSNFLHALKSHEVRRQYPKLLKIFLDINEFELGKNNEERAQLLFQQSLSKKKWLETQIIKFIEYQKQRIEKKEIVAGTLKNY